MWFIETFVYPALGGAAGALLVAQFLARKLIEHRFEKDMANFQATLTEKTENLKNSLSIFAHERNTQNARVDSQTAEAIHTVYSAMCVLLKNAKQFANGSPAPVSALEEHEGIDSQKAREFRYYKEKAELTSSAAKTLESTLLDNAIFIESDVYEKIENLSERFFRLSNSYIQIIIDEQCGRDEIEEIVDDLEAKRDALSRYYNGELSALVDEIVIVFRDKLGIEKI
ncbi:hypothetical protein Q9252_14075 [Marinobacter salarius]|uniref:hypothetical protein n=1 Tax=Marinobacter TaxID=2742 RepID=UPI0023584B04|nr:MULTISPECIES: hypothetical protein [Marinobacter]MDC8457707.1 hypothetical protein [Marinobacter sp. DS40M6]MDP4533272.1 hypothetical protein [Marinobacter salarius]